jgi:hypothetical protein
MWSSLIGRSKVGNKHALPDYTFLILNVLTAIGTVLYETRLGGLDDNRTEEMQRFIQAVRSVFVSTNTLFMLPRKLNKVFAASALKEHDDAWTTIYTTCRHFVSNSYCIPSHRMFPSKGKKCIDSKVAEMEEKLAKGEQVEGFLASILFRDEISQEEAYSSTADLMMAAVDTVRFFLFLKQNVLFSSSFLSIDLEHHAMGDRNACSQPRSPAEAERRGDSGCAKWKLSLS